MAPEAGSFVVEKVRQDRHMLGRLVTNTLFCGLFSVATATAIYFVERSALAFFNPGSLSRLWLGVMACLMGWAGMKAFRFYVLGKHRWWLSICFAAGLLVATQIPPVRDVLPTVTVTATGQHNPASRGSEAWIKDVEPGAIYLSGQDWERRDNSLSVSYKNQPATAELVGRWRKGDQLYLNTHPYSGIVVVRLGNEERRIDLYSAVQAEITLELPEAVSSKGGKARRVLYGLIPLFAALSVGVLLISLQALPARLRLALTASLILAIGTGIFVASKSFPGALELLAYGNSAVDTFEADSGQGPFSVPLKEGGKGGPSVAIILPRGAGVPVRLSADTGYFSPLAPLNEQTKVAAHELKTQTVDACVGDQRIAIFQITDNRGNAIRVDQQGVTHALTLAGQMQGPSFAVITCGSDRVSVAYTRALIRINPWQYPQSFIRALRLRDREGHELPVLQLSTDRPVGYAELLPTAEGYQRVEISRPDSRTFVIQKIIAMMFAAFLPFLIWLAVSNFEVTRRHWLKGYRLQPAWLYLAPVVAIAAVLAMQWPATVGWDAYSPFILAQTGSITLWYGIGYPMYVGALILLMSPVMIGVMQCLIAALTVQALMVRCVTGSKWGVRIAVVICLLLPLSVIPLGATVHLRDGMNGVLAAGFGVFWAFLVLRRMWPERSVHIAMFALLAIAGVILVLLRVDNLVLVAVLMLALPFLMPSHKKVYAIYGVLTAIALVYANPVAERLIVGGTQDDMTNLYAESAIISPLVGALTNSHSLLTPQDRLKLEHDLEAVIDLPRAVANWNAYNVIWWHENIVGRPLPDTAQIKALRADLIGLVKADPVYFLRMRTAMFASMLGSRSIWTHTANEWTQAKGGEFLDRVVATADPDSVAINHMLGYAVENRPLKAVSERLFAFYNQTATTVPQLVFCILLVILIRIVPVSGVLALALLARAGVFFLLAPADVFLYLYDLYFLGTLLFALALCEHHWRRGVRPRGLNWQEEATSGHI